METWKIIGLVWLVAASCACRLLCGLCHDLALSGGGGDSGRGGVEGGGIGGGGGA